jgi:hypothetical protein
MGGYDIFFTDLLEDNTWNDAINIGFPLNTTGDDLFYFPVENGEKHTLQSETKKNHSPRIFIMSKSLKEVRLTPVCWDLPFSGKILT